MLSRRMAVIGVLNVDRHRAARPRVSRSRGAPWTHYTGLALFVVDSLIDHNRTLRRVSSVKLSEVGY